ncbi:hypothetical protein SY83_13920 [Paenibacillus swuensis]|uniref:Anthranilate phosphoribosyltransferase n=1 Tax=Paenibacillus swuensis TaxID=1178515 RepID=A0A172TJF7_9BACL|nr:hypothetical protein [Paenibacillus swuensis]ANE47181.1 hypothetical protein SY83_13920 [Paenibacillus swuensis]
MKPWIRTVLPGKNEPRPLTYDEAVAAAHAIARGEATDAQTASLLTALRMRGETDEEIGAFVDVFRKYTLPFASFSESYLTVEGASRHSRFPVSFAVSLLLASVGIPLAIQGGADHGFGEGYTYGELLRELGIEIHADNATWEHHFAALRIGYISSEQACPPFASLQAIQGQLGVCTVAETVEKMLNPLQSHTLITGVKDKATFRQYDAVFPKVGFKTAYFIQGHDGSEDVPLHKGSTIRKVCEGVEQSLVVDPITFGFQGEPLVKRSKLQQKEGFLRILKGHDSPDLALERDHIIFNTGLRLFWFERVGSYEEGFQLAKMLLQRREGEKQLVKWSEMAKEMNTAEKTKKAN